MKIILKENIENLGKRGDIIDVAAGYGRNYLIPRKLAVQVTSANMKMVELEQKALQKKLELEVESFQPVIDQLNQASLSFERKAGDKDVIFGSVSVTDIKEALDKLGMEVEKIDNVPYDLLIRILPSTQYAVFTLNGTEIHSDWNKTIYEDWLQTSDYEISYHYNIQLYNFTRFF